MPHRRRGCRAGRQDGEHLLLWSCVRANYEALSLARSLGVQPGKLRTFLNIGSGANRPLAEWGAQRLCWPKKDLEMALALADTEFHGPLLMSLREAQIAAPLMGPRGVREHREYVEALRRRDVDEAKKVMTTHLKRTASRVKGRS